MRIGVYGHTDKRPVIYALLKLLQATGDVALLTNNRHYNRLLEPGERQGHFANVMVAVTDATPDEVFEEIGYAPDDFDHVVFDLQDTIPDELHAALHVKAFPPSEDEQALLGMLNAPVTVKMTYDGKREKNAIHVAPASLVWKTTERIEHYRILEPVPSKELNVGFAKLLAPHLSMKPKQALAILTRRWSR
ncbi:hypothetical protein [Cohnella sp. GCM10027633]|uniref:hypothetical protein n=1 Tax=unclassified Cohnella TaxID=2636738 RepID=UPI00362CEB02